MGVGPLAQRLNGIRSGSGRVAVRRPDRRGVAHEPTKQQKTVMTKMKWMNPRAEPARRWHSRHSGGPVPVRDTAADRGSVWSANVLGSGPKTPRTQTEIRRCRPPAAGYLAAYGGAQAKAAARPDKAGKNKSRAAVGAAIIIISACWPLHAGGVALTPTPGPPGSLGAARWGGACHWSLRAPTALAQTASPRNVGCGPNMNRFLPFFVSALLVRKPTVSRFASITTHRPGLILRATVLCTVTLAESRATIRRDAPSTLDHCHPSTPFADDLAPKPWPALRRPAWNHSAMDVNRRKRPPAREPSTCWTPAKHANNAPYAGLLPPPTRGGGSRDRGGSTYPHPARRT